MCFTVVLKHHVIIIYKISGAMSWNHMFYCGFKAPCHDHLQNPNTFWLAFNKGSKWARLGQALSRRPFFERVLLWVVVDVDDVGEATHVVEDDVDNEDDDDSADLGQGNVVIDDVSKCYVFKPYVFLCFFLTFFIKSLIIFNIIRRKIVFISMMITIILLIINIININDINNFKKGTNNIIQNLD